MPYNPLVETPVSEIGKYGDKLVLGTAFFLDDERLPSRVDRNGFFQFTYPFPSEGPIRPNLAESWSWNSDGTELKIKLRKGIKWSDGEPFTVDDVKSIYQDTFGTTGISTFNADTILYDGEIINPTDSLFHLNIESGWN